MSKTIRIGTRDSQLALWQANTVQKQLHDLGYKTEIVAVTFDVQLPVNLLRVDGVEGPEYYLTFHNFYVITRYNRSPLYAMATVDMISALVRPDVATLGVVEQKERHYEAVNPNP